MEQESSKNPVIIGVIAVAIIVILVGGVIALTGKDDTSTSETSAPTTATEQPVNDESTTENTVSEAGTYKSGTYDAEGTYSTPEGQESISVKITLNGNIISGAEVTSNAKARESKQYQSAFISGFKQQVVGKNIDEVKLSKVSGSSLTPRGFNDALDEIRSEAKS